VRGYAEDLGAHCSPTSMAIMKRQVYQHLSERLGPAEKEAIALMLESFGRPDFKEGVSSFLEKRPPRFERV
jgi:enoyl-CoA hydratase/carnithine racemase